MTTPEARLRLEATLAELASDGDIPSMAMVTSFVVVVEGIDRNGGETWDLIAPEHTRLSTLLGLIAAAEEDTRAQVRRALESDP